MELPIYELMISDDLNDDAEVNFVALVDKPAVQRNWNAFKEKVNFQIISDEKRIISGLLMLSDTPIFRSDATNGDYYVTFSKDTIFKIAQRFFKKGYQANVNLMHEASMQVDGLTMFESFISDKDRGISPMKGFEDAPDGSWFGSFKVDNEEVWQMIKEGKVRGFSVEGVFEYSKQKTKDEVLMEKIFKILQQVEFGGPGSGRHPEGGTTDDSSVNISQTVTNTVSNIEDGNPPSISELMKIDKENPIAASILEDISYNNSGSYKELDNEGKKTFDKLTTKKDYELYRVDTRYNIENTKSGSILDFEKSPTFVASDINYVKNLSSSRGDANPSVIVFEKGTNSIRHRKKFENGSHEVIRGSYKVDKVEDGKIYVSQE